MSSLLPLAAPTGPSSSPAAAADDFAQHGTGLAMPYRPNSIHHPTANKGVAPSSGPQTPPQLLVRNRGDEQFHLECLHEKHPVR